MSKVKRHSVTGYGRQDINYNDPEGEFVYYEDYAALQQKLDAMAAENASMMALAIACEKEFGSYSVDEFPDDEKVSLPEDRCHITFGMIRNALNKTATDAYLNSVRAEGVEKLLNKYAPYTIASSEASEFAARLRSGTHDTADKAD